MEIRGVIERDESGKLKTEKDNSEERYRKIRKCIMKR
jgi:hypothetical protein